MTPRVTRGPFVLLGLMTLVTAVGPVAIALTIRGGPSPRWPPDRPIEWWTFGVATGLVITLMTACLAVGLSRWRRTQSYGDDRAEDSIHSGEEA